MTLLILFNESQKKYLNTWQIIFLFDIVKAEKIIGVIDMLETQISDDGIKNFLSAVCDIIVYDWEYKKSFKAIDWVLKKLEKDKVFSQNIKNNADVLCQ